MNLSNYPTPQSNQNQTKNNQNNNSNSASSQIRPTIRKMIQQFIKYANSFLPHTLPFLHLPLTHSSFFHLFFCINFKESIKIKYLWILLLMKWLLVFFF